MKTLLLSLAFLHAIANLQAQPTIAFQQVASGFTEPTDIASAGDNRLFITERGGKIKILNGTQTLATTFLDMTPVIGNLKDGGLLSIAFHPAYATNGYFFVYYTETVSTLRSSGAITLARYKVSSTNPNRADSTSGVILMKILKPMDDTGKIYYAHNGGDLNFGKDGMLYFATGDGAYTEIGDPFNTAQNNQSLLGKMIRLDVSNFTAPPYYTIPKDNPYNYGTPTAARKEIWSTGLRNPFRWSFDRLTGDVWLGDVGQYGWEEINYSEYNRRRLHRADVDNFGWSCKEGLTPYITAHCIVAQIHTNPIFQYPHLIVNSQKQPACVIGGFLYRGTQYPALQGYHLASDMFSNNLYITSKNALGVFATTVRANAVPSFIVTYGEDKSGEIYAASIYGGNIYKVIVPAVTARQAPAAVTTASSQCCQVYPTITTTGSVHISLTRPATHLQVINMHGVILQQKDLKNQSGTVAINLPAEAKGMVVIRVFSSDGVVSERVVVE